MCIHTHKAWVRFRNIGLLFDFCWRSLRFALTTQKAVSHGPLPRLLSAVEVTPHGPPTQVSMATPRKLSKIKADYYQDLRKIMKKRTTKNAKDTKERGLQRVIA